jgi:branched-chain amino acid transport system permease protein
MSLTGLLRPLRARADLIALGAVYLAMYALPVGAPLGIQISGGAYGAVLALQAIGMVLVLRTGRLINFAQVQFGALSAVLFYELVSHVQLALFASRICPRCFGGVSNDPVFNQSHPDKFLAALESSGHHSWVVANFWLALVVSLLLAPVLSWLIYVTVMRRFNEAPRLIATVATIAVGSVLTAAASWVPNHLFQDLPGTPNSFRIPLRSVDLVISPVHFHLGDLVALAVPLVLLIGISGLLLFSDLGGAMAAAAENPRRALTLGISVVRVASTSWALAGLLSGVAAIITVLQTQASGQSSQIGGLDVTTLVQILAAVVFARMVSPWLAVAASVLLGIIDHVLLWNYSSPVPYQGFVLLPLIAGALLLQPSHGSRAEEQATASYLGAREARPTPRQLRHLPVVEGWTRTGSFLLAVSLLGFPFVFSPSQVSLGSSLVITAIIGLSLLVLTGWAGQISLGQFGFAAIGGYVTTLLAGHGGVPMPVCLVAGGIAGGAVAMLVGIPALRLRGLHLAVTTLAFSLATAQVVTNGDYLAKYLPTTIRRPSFLGINLNDEKSYFYFCLVLLVLAVVGVAGLRHSRTARVLIACRDNEQAGQSFGVSLLRARMEAFAISGFLAAFAGGLLAYHEHGLQALAFAPAQSLNLFLLMILGGLGSILGPILGVAYLGIFTLYNNPLTTLLATGLGTLGVMLMMPGGLSGLAFRARDGMLRRVAIRHRISVPSLLGDTGVDALSRRAPIAAKQRSGRQVFVPERYSLAGQLADAESRS